MSQQNYESWKTTAIIMISLSVLVFLAQRTSLAVFDHVFELCIFHIPALACSVIFYIKTSNRLS